MSNIKFVIYKCKISNNDCEKTICYEFDNIDDANMVLHEIGENFSDDFLVSHYETTSGFNGIETFGDGSKYNFYIDKK